MKSCIDSPSVSDLQIITQPNESLTPPEANIVPRDGISSSTFELGMDPEPDSSGRCDEAGIFEIGKDLAHTISGVKMPKDFDVLFMSDFGPIVKDDSASQCLYRETLGLPLKKEENNYCHTEELSGVKYFALWPLSQVSESCFGIRSWPADLPVPQAAMEFEVKDVAKATEVLKANGYKLLVSNRTEPWGQIVTRFLSPEGILLGVTYTPWLRKDTK